MTFDIARARRDTPGVNHVLHFNNAGCALPPALVVQAMQSHLWREATIGGYEARDEARQAVERVYGALATLINADADEIAVMDNATHAWDMAFYGLRLAPGDRILTSRSEYCSNYIAFLHRAKRENLLIDVAPSTPDGEVDVDALAQMITPKTKLIAITHVPTSSGLINPVAAIGAVAKAAGVPFLLDACQSVGQMPVDVQEIGCDMLSATGRKFLRGPRGTGFLYVRSGFLDQLDPPFLGDIAADWNSDGAYSVRGDTRRFEAPECNFSSKIGLGVAVDYALSWSMPDVSRRIRKMADLLRLELSNSCGAVIHDIGKDKCGIVTFSLPSVTGIDIRSKLKNYNINVTLSTRDATRLDMAPRNLHNIVRASVHYYNDDNEIDRFLSVIRGISRGEI